MFQWLRPRTSPAEDAHSIPGQGSSACCVVQQKKEKVSILPNQGIAVLNKTQSVGIRNTWIAADMKSIFSILSHRFLMA